MESMFNKTNFDSKMVLKTLLGPGLFRLILALVVFGHHASRMALGSAAVEIFFCLSGYWIFVMWRDRYSKFDKPYLIYIISRFWRLIPTFVLIVIITLLFQYFVLEYNIDDIKGGENWIQFVFSHVFILGYNDLEIQPLVPAWSLDVEMQFYIIAPILTILLVRIGSAPIIIVTSMISLFAALKYGGHFGASYIVFFVLGMSAAHLRWMPSLRTAILFILVAAAIVGGTLISPWKGVLLGGANPSSIFAYSNYFNTILAFLIFPFAIFTTGNVGGNRDGMYADLSYIVYLLHWSAIGWLGSVASFPILLRLLCFVFAIIMTLFGSYLIWKFYDRPINRERSRWVSSRLVKLAERN